MKRGITQKEIANRLGVSQALVSRALSGTSSQIDASPVTVAAILKAAAEWNYQPNAAAQALKGIPSRTLGVFVRDFDDPYFGHLIGTLQGLARSHHYGLILLGWDMGTAEEPNEHLLRKYQPDGLLVCGSDYTPRAALGFASSHKTVVQIGLGDTLPEVHQIGVDEAGGFNLLVAHLAALGHQRIGFLGGSSISHRRRLACLEASLQRHGLPAVPAWFSRLDSPRDIESVLLACLAGPRDQRPTALVAADDVTAQRILRGVHSLGRSVPKDLSIAGFDDIPAAQAMIPSLTSIHQPLEEMAREAFRLATEKPQPDQPARRILVPPSLEIRESSAPPGPEYPAKESENT